VLANAAQGQGDAPSELAHLVNEQVDIARKQVNYHLARAQAAAASRLPGVKTELLSVILGLVRGHATHSRRSRTGCPCGPLAADLSFRGETHDLQEMLGNLLDNACKWAVHHVDVNAAWTRMVWLSPLMTMAQPAPCAA
jgi:signal transduction histidine kinase